MVKNRDYVGIFVCGLGNGGVSHETLKTKLVLENMGYNVFIITGKKGKYLPSNGIIEVPDLGFSSSQNIGLESICFPYIGSSLGLEQIPKQRKLIKRFKCDLEKESAKLPTANPSAEHAVKVAAAGLEQQIKRVIKELNIKTIIAENFFAIPMHPAAAVAVGDIIKEMRVPSIAIHHDFYWERHRFQKSTIMGILTNYFPPCYKNLVHVVINTHVQKALKNPKDKKLIDPDFGARPRKSIDALVLPNFFNFDFSPGYKRHTHTLIPTYPREDNYNKHFRRDFGFRHDDVLLLQHSRIVERKNIERSVDLLVEIKKRMSENKDKYKLVIACKSLDEGNTYYKRLMNYIESKGLSMGNCYENGKNEQADVVFIGDRIAEARCEGNGAKIYHYLDPYAFCDFVCYPSLYEGWGNSLGEAIQARKPVMVNRYSVYNEDIATISSNEGNTFKFVEIDNKVTPETVTEVLRLIDDKKYRNSVVNDNFEIAKENIGYDAAEKVFKQCFDLIKQYRK